RQTGGIGTRGPGETQLEVDRRRLRERVVHIKRELERVQSSRELHRAKRQSVPIPTISLVGYTNAGKSTLMRSLTQANVLVEDKLFATLDPTIRRLKLPSGRQALLADTVGFIKKLPHALVESFKATFEEIEGSDILVHVIDASHPMREHQIRQVYEVLEELGLSKKPVVEVYNKIDLMGYNHQEKKGKIGISALRQEGLDLLLQKLDRLLSRGYKKIQLLIPYQEGALLSFLHDSARVITKNYAEDGVHLEVEVFEKYLAQLKKFKVK
ncbi:MAG: GTPase HflX, partial [Deltaproteobacteria bacterium]|nr:GTPase HflX [Deltaproteobacteria bacterium]